MKVTILCPRFCVPSTLIATALTIVGCRTMDSQVDDFPDDVAATRVEREEDVIEDFERTRDGALYQSALAQWRDGDAVACESILVRLLQRSDGHRAGRVMLADLYASTGKPKAAEQHLRLLTERNDDDAQAHHSLGMLLEASGKFDQALQHLQKAAELEPDNELYSLSYEAAQADLHVPNEGKPKARQAEIDETPYCFEIKG